MPPVIAKSPEISVPLCVDLDGTLIRTDVLWESLVLLLKRNPLYLLALPFWLLRGRAFLKKQIARRTELNPADLPYHESFLEYLKSEHRQGRPLILATAADMRLAQAVANHVGLFNEVLASDGTTNLRGKNKGNTLSERFGKKGFDYAGNSTVDLPVWQQSREAIVVNANDHLARRAAHLTTVGRVFNEPGSVVRALLKTLRPHQWVKNLLIFVPLLTSHKIGDARLMGRTLLAFAAFSLCASGVYVLNDLLDLAVDRHHPAKRRRPFASGALPLPVGLILAPLMLVASAVVAGFASRKFLVVLAVYIVLAMTHSSRFKKNAPLDVCFVTGLYTLRLIAGYATTGIPYSFWLVTCSILIFLGLALLRRRTANPGPEPGNPSSRLPEGY